MTLRKAIPFIKIQGAGNDCLVCHRADLVNQAVTDTAAFMRAIAHRQLGIGADQILEIVSLSPLAIQVWNCDGSQAELCGNGARSFAVLALKEGWAKGKKFPLEVSGSTVECVGERAKMEIGVGLPKVIEARRLQIGAQAIPYVYVDVGNPHAVIFCSDALRDWTPPADFDYREWGAAIESHSDFPQKANVEFVRTVRIGDDQTSVKLLVEAWERGAGATASCGSGAVAVVAAYRQQYLPNLQEAVVQMTRYELTVRVTKDNLYLGGPTEVVARGEYLYA